VNRCTVIGGFVGSGKTTALLRLARVYANAGLDVGIITNDQSDGTVDTETFRAAGFKTEEVPGGCFCCRFDDLIAAAGRLQDGHHPDVLLAEPVGSCTDIVATVIEPFQRLYADRFAVAPYVTLLDPDRAYQALTGSGRAGFSAKVTYLYKMQQNEADIVAINKIDTLSQPRRTELRALVERNFPKAKVIEISARTGEGFDRLIELLEAGEPVGGNVAAVDYDLYAEAEARLGWLNAAWRVTAADGFDADRLLLELAAAIQKDLAAVGIEPAHVKMALHSGDNLALANVVSSDRSPELSRASRTRMTDAKLIINARVESEASALRDLVGACVETVTCRMGGPEGAICALCTSGA
jgi:Ni2+-binding GTPase involved in maturation of urease and hydrogenase